MKERFKIFQVNFYAVSEAIIVLSFKVMFLLVSLTPYARQCLSQNCVSYVLTSPCSYGVVIITLLSDVGSCDVIPVLFTCFSVVVIWSMKELPLEGKYLNVISCKCCCAEIFERTGFPLLKLPGGYDWILRGISLRRRKQTVANYMVGEVTLLLETMQ